MPFVPGMPWVNGNRYSFSSVEACFGGRRFVGIKSVNYNTSQEPGEVRGTAPQLIGRTRGKYAADGNFEMYRAEFQDMATFMMATPSPAYPQVALGSPFIGLHDVIFDIVVNFAEDQSPVVTDVLYSCRMKKIDLTNQEGTDPSSVKVDLSIMRITLGELRTVGNINLFGIG